MIYSLPKIIQNQTPKIQKNMTTDRNFLRWDTSHIWNNRQEPSSLWGTLASSSSTVLPSYAKLIKWSKKHRDPYGRSRNSLCNEMSGYALYTYILPADDMGVVGHVQKTQLPCHLQSEKNRKCISPVSCVKCLGKKNHMTWDLCVQKMQNMSCQLTHTLYYLLAVGIIQNYTSAVRIFQSHMNPFTSLFYLATI